MHLVSVRLILSLGAILLQVGAMNSNAIGEEEEEEVVVVVVPPPSQAEID